MSSLIAKSTTGLCWAGGILWWLNPQHEPTPESLHKPKPNHIVPSPITGPKLNLLVGGGGDTGAAQGAAAGDEIGSTGESTQGTQHTHTHTHLHIHDI